VADVFISYARPDRPIAAALSKVLDSEGWEVWYDEELRAGTTWEPFLLEELESAKAVVAIWSANAKASEWVQHEAKLALEAAKLVPVVVDGTPRSTPLAVIQAVLMPGWNGEVDHPGLPQLFRGLEAHASPSRIDTVRPGYDEDFLETKIGLPDIPGTGDEFRYLHFSVVMNPSRRLAWYVA
jgi:TIR domain